MQRTRDGRKFFEKRRKESIDQMLKGFDDVFAQVDDKVIGKLKLAVMTQGYAGTDAMGGVELHTRGIDEEILKKHPLTIHHIYTTKDANPKEHREKLGLGEVIHHPIHQDPGPSSFFRPKILDEFRKITRDLIREEGVNMVHVRSPHTPAGNAVAKVAQTEGVPAVMTFHQSRRRWLLHQPVQMGMSLVQNLVLPDTQRRVGHSFGISNDSLDALGRGAIYMGNGIDTDHFNPEKTDEKEFLKDYPQLQGKKVILLPGRITRIKGQMILLQAYEMLPERLKEDSMVVIAGPAGGRGEKYKTDVEAYVKAHALEGKVIMTGGLSQRKIAQANKAATFVAVPSLEEPLGRVVVEGNSMEKAVIASDVGGIPEAMDPNITGLLFEPGNAQQLSQKIEFLLDNPDVAEAMGKNGRGYAKTNFSRRSLAQRHLRVYSNMLRRHMKESARGQKLDQTV